MTKIIILLVLLCVLSANAQDGRVSGNFKSDGQYYFDDENIGAIQPDDRFRSNNYLNLRYNQNNIEFGIRYEAYMQPLLGFSDDLNGKGIANRYVSYTSDFISLTAGNFYGQFGSGLIFRSYEEKDLGIDNSMDGIKFILNPINGLQLTGIVGTQRNFWEQSNGLVRAGDLDLQLNELAPNLFGEDIYYTLGTSFVSKYEKDITEKYPENILAFSSRFAISSDNFTIDGEWASKINDPNSGNKYNFNEGYAYILNTSAFGDGWGLSLGFHKTDNMDFRSQRSADLTAMTINFLPPMTKYHTYTLAGIFPFATQLNGEAGYQAEFTYKLPRKTAIGGKYGTDMTIAFSRINAIDTTRQVTINGSDTTSKYYYDSPILGLSDELYYQDFSLEVSRKINKTWKTKFKYVHSIYNKDILEKKGTKFGMVTNNLIAWENLIKFNNKHAIRFETQLLLVKDDFQTYLDNAKAHFEAEADNKDKEYEPEFESSNGDWVFLLAEYSFAPSLFITVFDQFNYGNLIEKSKQHYPSVSMAYLHNSTRIAFGYGRTREGLLCSGGVCRTVESSNGFNFSISTSF